MNSDNIIKSIFEHYGEDAQLIVAIEEMSELIKELTKWMRYRDTNSIRSICEESADALICIGHIEMAMVKALAKKDKISEAEAFNIYDAELDKITEDKLIRQARRIVEEKKL